MTISFHHHKFSTQLMVILLHMDCLKEQNYYSYRNVKIHTSFSSLVTNLFATYANCAIETLVVLLTTAWSSLSHVITTLFLPLLTCI